MKTNCPFCNAPKTTDSGLWDYFGCGTDVDRQNKVRQSYACLTIQRDNLLIKINELDQKIGTFELKNYKK